MSKERFRDVKRKSSSKKPTQIQYPYAKVSLKIKAFLTDSFMLMMPILYIVIYFIMGGRENFAEEKILGWIYIFLPLIIIQTIFMTKSSQTPGYRAYNLHIIDHNTGERPTIFIILFRNASAILSFFSFFGWILMFFRKDSKTLHDLLSGTAIIYKPQETNET